MLRVSPTYGEAIRNLKRKRYQEALKREDYHAAALALFDLARKRHKHAKMQGLTVDEYREKYMKVVEKALRRSAGLPVTFIDRNVHFDFVFGTKPVNRFWA